jgi:coproporphyrinogen III oxidase
MEIVLSPKGIGLSRYKYKMNTSSLNRTATTGFRQQWIEFIYALQAKICVSLEDADGKAKFTEEEWQRKPDGKGGGGKTKVISNGNVFEKGGVNSSVVYGMITPKMRKGLQLRGSKWFACGLSLVLHPVNPFVPTLHGNYRYFELYDKEDAVCDRWFGGGADLTPYYLFEEDAKQFHKVHKNACDKFDRKFYPLFKKNCDEYFVNVHRKDERRGIGGIFFDRRRPEESQDLDFWFNFCKTCGNSLLDVYLPIVEKRKSIYYEGEHKHWQEIRRGRYVEFNLIHDKGTLFGLKTGGRTESILMSLPPTARFEYNYQPVAGSEEDKLLQVCLHPVDWV